MNPAPCVFCSGHRDGVYLLKHDQLAALSCTLMSRHSVHLLYLMDKERKKQKKTHRLKCVRPPGGSGLSLPVTKLAKVTNRGEQDQECICLYLSGFSSSATCVFGSCQ